MKVFNICLLIVLVFSNAISLKLKTDPNTQVPEELTRYIKDAGSQLKTLRKATNKVASHLYKTLAIKYPKGFTEDNLNEVFTDMRKSGADVPSPQKTHALMTMFDENFDGVIDKEEWQKMWFYIYTTNAEKAAKFQQENQGKKAFLQSETQRNNYMMMAACGFW